MKNIIIGLVMLILVCACSPGGESVLVETSTLTVTVITPASTPTLTPTAAPTITPTPNPPTAIPASPTPVSPQIRVDTIGKLSVFSTFGQGEVLRSLAFSPDGTVLASAGGNTEDFNIRVWDVESGSLLQTLEGHSGIIWTVAFSPDGQMLASVSSDGTGKIWDWQSGSLLETLNFTSEVVSVTFSPDGQTLAIGGVEEWPNAAIWTFSVPSWQPGMKLSEFWNIPALVYSADGKTLVGGGTSRNVRVWRASDGSELFILNHSGQVSSLAISPDDSTIAAGLCEASGENGSCTKGAVWFWDLYTGKLIHKTSEIPNWVEGVAYSTDGSLLIAGMRDGTLRFYTSTDYQLVFTTSSPGGSGIFTISPDGRLLASTGNDGLIHLWKVGP